MLRSDTFSVVSVIARLASASRFAAILKHRAVKFGPEIGATIARRTNGGAAVEDFVRIAAGWWSCKERL